jgi:hypothetical protein
VLEVKTTEDEFEVTTRTAIHTHSHTHTRTLTHIHTPTLTLTLVLTLTFTLSLSLTHTQLEDSNNSSWGIVGVSKLRVVRGQTQYRFEWEQGGASWESRSTWCTEWSVDFEEPWLSRAGVLQRLLELENST